MLVSISAFPRARSVIISSPSGLPKLSLARQNRVRMAMKPRMRSWIAPVESFLGASRRLDDRTGIFFRPWLVRSSRNELPENQMLTRSALACSLLVAFGSSQLGAQGAPDPALAAKVDSIANQVLQTTGVPSASLAVVKNGRLVYANAYGAARLEPRAAAMSDMRYAIGSI